jgi:hypothetical protein
VGTAIGATLPLAVGVAISPLPIIAVILLLVTPRARTCGLAFLAGWLVGLVVVGAVVLLVAQPAGTSSEGAPATWAAVVQLAIGVLLLLLAAKQWRARPADDREVATPTWMGAIDAFTARKALALGVVFSGVKPKNLLLTIGAATLIAETGISAGQQAVALGVFVVVASVGIAVPVVIFFALGTRAGAVLGHMKAWMLQHNAVIMTTLFVVFGAVLIGDAISGLSA